MERISEILFFWFGVLADDGLPVEDRSKLWFGSDVQTDKLIRDSFEADLHKAAKRQLVQWERNPKGRLALILLLDQFSRNIYRGTPQAFAQDSSALSLCLEGIDKGHDLTLQPIERVFFYLPLEHSESLEMQDRSVKAYATLVRSLPASTAQTLQSSLDHAIRHRDIIRRFGRFPHRNKILGRPSMPEELQFLSSGTTFGQGQARLA